VVGASAVVDGWTDIGDGTEIFSFASIGLIPQDLKFKGEETRLVIGRGNIFREFVTIHRGTRGGGGVTTIGDRNVFMAYVHVAHDCHVGNDTIFGNMATLGGHVTVEIWQRQRRIGRPSVLPRRRFAFIGGCGGDQDALPFARTVGSRRRGSSARTPSGLARRVVPLDVIELKVVPISSAVEAEHHQGHADPATINCHVRVDASWTSSAPLSAASSCAAAPRRWSLRVIHSTDEAA
jgi:acyl-ACP--UDP-N-acetylglucosamine O-acyltransferase